MKINRYYICDNCDHHFIKKQNINDELVKKCPKCRKHAVYQDLTGQHTFVYGEPTTVGHAAERNTAKAGKYELEAARSQMPDKKKKVTPWYNPDGKDLPNELSHLDTNEKRQNYIFKGE